MRQARLVTGALFVCAAFASGSVAAEDANQTASEGTASSSVPQHTYVIELSPRTLSLLNGFAIGYLLGGSPANEGGQVLKDIVSEMTVNYAHDLILPTACQNVVQSGPDARTVTATIPLQTAWSLSGPWMQFQQQLKSFTLKDYLPVFQVTIHEVPVENQFSIRIVRSPDGSVIRVVHSPGS